MQTPRTNVKTNLTRFPLENRAGFRRDRDGLIDLSMLAYMRERERERAHRRMIERVHDAGAWVWVCTVAFVAWVAFAVVSVTRGGRR